MHQTFSTIFKAKWCSSHLFIVISPVKYFACLSYAPWSHVWKHCNMKPSFSALRVVVLAFLVSDYILPLVSLEFELTILALTSDTLMFTVFALWLELSLLKSPRHLFNRVIVFIAYKKVCHIHIHTHSSYWIAVILAETFKPQSLNVNLWWLPIQSHLIPSAQLKRQHTRLELQSFWSQLQLPILSSSWFYFGVSYIVKFCFEVLYSWVTYLNHII